MKSKTLLFFILCTSLFGIEIKQVNDFISKQKCSEVFTTDVYTICYDDTIKSAIVDTYIINAENLLKPSIIKRPNFYSESSLPRDKRVESIQFHGSGLDQGHLANDSTFDYDQKTLEETYNLINIIPQYPRANRRTWRMIENYERELAGMYGDLTVINYITYSNLKINGLSVPDMMYKFLIHNETIECYGVKNTNDKIYHSSPLESYKIQCEDVIK